MTGGSKADIQAGDIVKSLKGRDANRIFLVLSAKADMLTLSDGRFRRVEKPKRKNPKHVQWIARPSPGAETRCTNRELRKRLQPYIGL